MLIRKKDIRQIDVNRLQEPVLGADDAALLEQGVALFNEGRFWEAHEVWEKLWRMRSEESRIFFQGIIQVAAGFHRILEKPLLNGAVKNLDKAMEKLRLFGSDFLGIDVGALRSAVMTVREVLVTEGLPKERERLEALRPRMMFRRPSH